MTDTDANLIARVIGSAARGIIKAIAMHSQNQVSLSERQHEPSSAARFEDIIADEGLGWNQIEELFR